jgi:Nucleotidyltransferase of unknown function (DUF6036)
MRTYSASEIKSFLLALDQRLSEPLYLEVIGSAAAMLGMGMVRDTKDFDTTVSIDSFAEAWADTQRDLELNIPLDRVTVHQPPYEYESRLIRLRISKLKKIQIFIPEKHDWVLLKIPRLNEKDREHILDVAIRLGFSERILLERFIDEMWMAMGNRSDLVWNFLTCIQMLFGAKARDNAKAAIEADRRWK